MEILVHHALNGLFLQVAAEAKGDVTVPLWLVVTSIAGIFGSLTTAVGILWRSHLATEVRQQENIRVMVESTNHVIEALRENTKAIQDALRAIS